MTIQRILIALIFGLIFFWKGPDWISVKGLETSSMNDHLFSGFICAASIMALYVYTQFRKKTGIFNGLLIYWIGLSLLAPIFSNVTHSLCWHSLLVNVSGVLITVLLFEAYFFIRKLEEK